MSEPTREPVTGDRERAEHPGLPRWVKVSVIVVAVVLVVLVLAMLVTGGEHGPGRHGAASGLGGGVVAAPTGG